jgi:hypothetical protein
MVAGSGDGGSAAAPVLPEAGGNEQRDARGRRERGQDRRPEASAARAVDGQRHDRHVPRELITLVAMKIVVVAVLIAIVAALFAALVFLYRDQGRGKRVVWLLTLRVGLSVSLIAFLLFSYWMGWIGPGGVR